MPRSAGMPKLPIDEMKASTAPASSDGQASGRITERVTRPGPAPPSRAASTRSRGRPRKPARMARNAKVECSTPMTSTTPHRE